jgi:predicted nucleotidyltransferase
MTRQTAIEETTRRLAAYFRPMWIYLFGSEARGESGPDSDLDFMVVVPDGAPPESMRAGAFYRHARGIPYPIDVVVWKASEFERRLHLRASFPSTVVREGRLVYGAADLAGR